MRQKAISLLQELTEAHSVPGHEDEVRAIFINELEDCGEFSSDLNGSVFCELPGDGPRVMIAGHMDEVGFMVQNITAEGFIQIVALGGWWEHSLLSQRLEILTRRGDKVVGVICSRPPHFMAPAARKNVISIDQMYLDVGANSKHEVVDQLGISLGDPIAPVSKFTPLAHADRFMGKAMDNRLGMAGVIQAGEVLAKSDRVNHVILCGTVQEEMGMRGARTAATVARPDVVIVLEGPPADDTPGFNRSDSQGAMGSGVQIRMLDGSAILHPRFTRFAIEQAEKSGIPHQVTVRRSGGTDAGVFQIANSGVPCVVLGTPARYIHSHNSIADINDYLNMLALTITLVKSLNAEVAKRLTTYL